MDGAEAALVGLAQLGDEVAFEELVKRRQAPTRQLMYRLSGDLALADDLAQLTFLKVWQKVQGLQDPSRFPGWFKRIAVNTWISHARKHDLLLYAQKEAEKDTDQDIGVSSRFRDPTLVDDLEHALSQLSPASRSCVVLAYLEGMTNEEVSEQLNMPLGTVKSHIRRGSQTLREALSDYEDTKNNG